jgi:predicted DNA-binding protein (MmcQ/YjbR family)
VFCPAGPDYLTDEGWIAVKAARTAHREAVRRSRWSTSSAIVEQSESGGFAISGVLTLVVVAHPIMFDEADPVLGRVRALALAFPDAAEKISHGHPAFFTTKVFAYYGGSVKVDGTYRQHERSVLVLVDPDEREALLSDNRCYVPAYLGVYGWIGVDLTDDTDWDEINELLDASYRGTAGPRRVAVLDARVPGT